MILENRCLDVFPGFLRTLGDDARLLVAVLENPAASDSARRRSAAALTYLFKSLDLIPEDPSIRSGASRRAPAEHQGNTRDLEG